MTTFRVISKVRNGATRRAFTLFATTIFLFCPGYVLAQTPAPGTPGPEHEVLQALVGDWEVSLEDEVVGSATARLRLGDRFLEMELHFDSGPLGHAIYVFGFDRRHDVYTVVFFDDSGTYWVTAQGTDDNGRMAMYGEDEDPVMRSMGLDKEYIIVLDVHSPDHISLETIFIDTRTPERNEMPFVAYHLRRQDDGSGD